MQWLSYFKLHKTKIRFLYWTSVLLGMFFVILPMFFFFYRFDEDQVKQMIIDQVASKYQVEVNGKVIPKFWHGLSLEIDDVMVSTQSDARLLHIDTINCQMSWLDLAVGNYRVKRIALNGVKINEKNAMNYGLDNLLNLSNAHNFVFSDLRSLAVYGIQTEGDSLAYKINDGTLKIQQIGTAANFRFGLKLARQNQNTYLLMDGELNSLNEDVLKFDEFNLRIYNDLMRIDIVANTSYQLKSKKLLLENLNGRLTLNNYSGRLSANKLALTLSAGEIANGRLSLNFNNDLASQNLKISFDQLTLAGFKTVLVHQLDLQYEAELDNNKVNLDSTLEGLHINESAHIVSNTCTSKLNFSSPKLSSDGLSAELAGVCEYEADKSLLNLNLAGSLNEAPLKLAVKIFTGQNKPYAVVAGAIDSLDLSRLEVNKYKLLPLYYDDGLLPFSWLSLININADLAIKHFSLDRINLDNVSTKFSVANDKLTVDKVQADVYNGVLSGSGQITKVDNNYTIATKQTIKNLDLQSMFNDLFNVQAISGKANLNMNVLVKDAASYEDLHKRLNGQVVIDANHGEFQGIDLNLFVNPKDSMSLTTDKSTMFEQLKAKFNFENGISKNSSLNFSSPYVIATGNGLLDFLNTKLDYTMTIKSALPHNEQKISSVVIPVSISGDLFGPKVSIQNIHLFTKHSEVAKTPLKLKHSLHGIRKNKPHKSSKVVNMGKPHHNSRPITRG